MARKFRRIDAATKELAAGRDAHALELLRELFAETEDLDVLDEIRRVAVEAHESSQGFQRIEWQRLAIDVESREMLIPH